jgi:hypothetical protein
LILGQGIEFILDIRQIQLWFCSLEADRYPQVEQNPFKNKLKGIKRKGAKFVAFLCALASLRLCVELFLNLWVRIRFGGHKKGQQKDIDKAQAYWREYLSLKRGKK